MVRVALVFALAVLLAPLAVLLALVVTVLKGTVFVVVAVPFGLIPAIHSSEYGEIWRYVLRTSGTLAILQRDSGLQVRRRAVRLEAERRVGLELRRRAHAAHVGAGFEGSDQAQGV